ncbi:transcription cofactor vestigial-like protein 2a isoform X2 [Alosa alosa]|uniref:transcription cofactor vestigial-like protein 2a isoform X3 n=1 Tax=Alosa sapidissima TaxID=34773 RepID=UPI001C09A341|nr:transcription cofactor vestigial-like protein 2a isoform X3 [Alosa sapidissima]XP_048105737.1 transcription cofactor vestigial-like protein 2a isoform X2 [Alosa alosa]
MRFRCLFAMSCLDVMYQVYGPPQPYFAAAYSPYHHQLAFYSKMQEAQEGVSGGSSFSNLPGASIKEEDCAREKDHPPEAEYINSRCVLFTYFQGDISSVVDEHFSRALSQSSSYVPSSTSNKSARGTSFWRDGSFPMNQRSFPPSFWNSAYQPSVSASLSSALSASHSELPFPADPYSPASLHSHLHQATQEPWHPSHHHHHPYSLGGAISTQGSAYPRPGMHDVYGTHFDPRYGSLLVPSVRPHRLPPASVPAPGSSPCDISKSEPTSSSWTAAFTSTGSEMGQSLGLNVDAGIPTQDKSKDLYWF